MPMNILKGRLGLLVLPLLLIVIYGCGPGFPIVTEEQQDFMDKVDRTAKETAALEKRLTTLESRGADKEGVEELKTNLAETTRAVEDLTREFSFVRGSLEESANARAQAESEISSLEEELRGLKEELRSLGATSTATRMDITQLKDGLAAATSRIAAMEGEVQVLKDTLKKSIEAGIAGATQGGAPSPAAPSAALAPAAPSPGAAATAVPAATAATAVSPTPALAGKTGGATKKAAGKGAQGPAVKPTPAVAPKVKKTDPEALYFRGFKLTKDKKYEKASEVFRRFLKLYPHNRLADHARYWLGEIYYSRGNWERAILEFDRVIKEYPGGDKVPAAILKEAFSFERLGSKKETRLLLEKLMDKYPTSPEAKMAAERIKKLK